MTFSAFLGFSVITSSAGDLADPARGLPRAMYTALGLTGSLYILVSLGASASAAIAAIIAIAALAVGLDHMWKRRRPTAGVGELPVPAP